MMEQTKIETAVARVRQMESVSLRPCKRRPSDPARPKVRCSGRCWPN